jgi:hypothetical protein
MAPSALAGSLLREDAQAPARVSWQIWMSVAGVTSACLGAHWDISWHRSIGRDTFWTPPHMAIYLCGVLAGIACGTLILRTTFRGDGAASVRVFGFRGPLGAFISAWGGVLMLTSAPFDNWWHDTYGLDVKILSPPHSLLALGILAVQAGCLILILGEMNRTCSALLEYLFVYVGGMIIISHLVFLMEYTDRNAHHSAWFYKPVCLAIPVVLAALARASRLRWPCTFAASVYTLFLLGLLWILPLFPAEPKLGPVLHPVTQFVPPEFPILIVAPAIALDLLWRRVAKWRSGWLQALVIGATFLIVLLVVQWPFARFLMSTAARNRFFGTIYFDYFTPHNSLYFNYEFWHIERTRSQLALGLGLAAVYAILSARIGTACGNWMRRICR